MIKFKILGCKWEVVEQQNQFKKLYQTLPAQVLEVAVESSQYQIITEYFQGDSPTIRTIDMRETENEEKLIEEEVEGRQEFEGVPKKIKQEILEGCGELTQGNIATLVKPSTTLDGCLRKD